MTSRWRGAWQAALILGYLVVLLRALQAVPGLERRNLTLSARLSELTGKNPTRDIKVATMVNEERGSARRTVESEEMRPTAEDLVCISDLMLDGGTSRV